LYTFGYYRFESLAAAFNTVLLCLVAKFNVTLNARPLVSGGSVTHPSESPSEHDETDMTEMLNELRILLPGAQLLNGFLITLPFNSGFQQIVQVEKWIFMATFVCSLSSLILFTTPAVQHRVLRPLDDREKFKNGASKQMIVGAVFLSLALVLCANLVTAEVVGHPLGGVVAALVSSMILGLWWISPLWRRRPQKRKP
jgi:divalent metal cation (Fe/Co/Zn/Cd) transporter